MDTFKYYEDYNLHVTHQDAFAYCYPHFFFPGGDSILTHICITHVHYPTTHVGYSTTNYLYYGHYMGIEDDNVHNKTQYVKIQNVDKPLSVKRKKVWSYKAPFRNIYRGKNYSGYIELSIFEPHIIDIEQSWYQPTVHVLFHTGADVVADLTWEQFEQSPFISMIGDTEHMHEVFENLDSRYTSSTVRKEYIEVRKNYNKECD